MCYYKRGSRHAARAAKSLRWRVDQITKIPYKENNSLLVMVYFISRSALIRLSAPIKDHFYKHMQFSFYFPFCLFILFGVRIKLQKENT